MSNRFYPLRVSDIQQETKNAKIIHFQLTDETSEAFQFMPGQYITLKINFKGQELRRAYSICSYTENESFAIGVKKVKKGKVSSFLHDNLSVGDKIDCMRPDGNFIAQPEDVKLRTHYFIAAGSGITPVMCMMLEVLEKEPQSRVCLFYGNRNEDNIMFKDRIDQWINDYRDQLFVEYILSKPLKKKQGGFSGLLKKAVTEWEGKVGRIDEKSLAQFFEEFPDRGDESVFYLCGPGGMIERVSTYLEGTGINPEQIKKEYFTNPDSESDAVQELVRKSRVRAHIEDKQIEIEMTNQKTVLEALVDAKFDPPYSCTSGACSTCVAKILEGNATMDVCYALDDDEVEDGYILTCQARPTSDYLEIRYEE